MTGHLDSLTLDRLLLGSLPEAEARAARAHLVECADCAAQLAELEADQKRFEAHVFARTLPGLEQRAARPSPLAWLSRVRSLAVPAAATLALGLALFVGVGRPAPEPDLRIKGGPTFKVFALHGERVFQVQPGTRLAAGDRIRFVVESESPRWLLVASRDGAGKVSVYFPPEGGRSARVEAGRSELPGSIELDAAPGPERLFAWFSDAPLEASAVAAALAAGDPGRVGDAAPVELAFDKETK